MTQIRVTRVAASTSAGDQDIRISGMTETPVAALIIASSATADDTLTAHAILSVGAGTGSGARWAMSYYDGDGLATTGAVKDSVANAIVHIRTGTGGGAIDGVADLVSFLSDSGSGAGVRINWSNAPSSAHLMIVVLFAVPGAAAGVYNTGGSAGSTTTVTPGFQTNLLICANQGASFSTTTTAPTLTSIGFCDGNLNQWAYLQRSGNAANPSVLNALLASSRVSGQTDTVSGEAWGSEITSITSTQFVATQRTAGGGGDQVGYLAIGGVGASVDLVDTQIGTADQTISGIGFQPQFAAYLVTGAEAVDTGYTDNRAGSFSLGFADGVSQYNMAWGSEDGVNPSNANSKTISNGVVQVLDDDGSVLALGGTNGFAFNSDGWAISWPTNSLSTAKKCITFAIQAQTGSPWYAYAQQ